MLAYSDVSAPWWMLVIQALLVCGLLLFIWDTGKDFTKAVTRRFGAQESVYMKQERIEVERTDDYDRPHEASGYVVDQVARKMRQFEQKSLPPGKR